MSYSVSQSNRLVNDAIFRSPARAPIPRFYSQTNILRVHCICHGWNELQAPNALEPDAFLSSSTEEEGDTNETLYFFIFADSSVNWKKI